MKKVLLINPQIHTEFSTMEIQPPLGLLSLGTVLSKNNYKVKILDSSLGGKRKIAKYSFWHGIGNADVVNYAKDYNPDIIGLGCLFTSKWKVLVSIAEDIKKALPDVFIVTGGIYPSMEPKKSLETQSNCIDFSIIGEGENSFLDLCNQLSNYNNINDLDQSFFDVIKDIYGIVFKKDGEIYVNPKKDYINNLDELPFPDYDLLEGGLNQYFDNRKFSNFRLDKRNLSIMTSRSCPNKCSFCNMRFTHGDTIRYRSPENVILEIKYLYDKYKINNILFDDDNVSLNKKRFKEICQQIIDLDFKVKWASQNGMMVNTLDDEVISLMAKSGCVFTGLAVESGDEKIRSQVIKKSIKSDKIEKVVNSLKRNNVFVSMFFIVGFFEDTNETIEKSKKLILKTKPHLAPIMPLQLFPGTALFNTYKSKGLIYKEYDVRDIKNELYETNIELYEGYSLNVKRWKRKLSLAYAFALFQRPDYFFKYYDFYILGLIFRFTRVLNWFSIK